jgi:signal transduction histidine kinase
MPMVADQIVLPHLWRRYLSLVRALVGAGCIWALLAGGSGLRPAVLVALLIFLTIFSLILVFWRLPERVDRFGIFGLILDVAMFLLCVALSDTAGFWTAAIAGFYLFLAMATLHDWRDVLLVTVLSLAFVGSVRPAAVDRLQPVLLILGMFGVVLTLQRQSLMQRLSNTSRQAVYYRSESEKARESERERIAADFHDGPLQSFISFQMRLEIVRKMLTRNHEAGVEELRQLREICDKQVTEMRTFVRSMRPIEIDGLGLAAAIRAMVGLFQKDSRIMATFDADPNARHDDLDATTDLLQVVREALHNVQKHSAASRVAVKMGRENSHLLLSIEDDGQGFPFAGAFHLDELEILRMGPASIQRRVRSMNGELTVESNPGHGSSIRVRVPLQN